MRRPTRPAFSSLSSTMPVVERSSPSSLATEIWSMPGLVLEHEQNAVLRVGDAELAGFLQEQRHRDLVRAPDHEAGAAIEFVERIVQASLASDERDRPMVRGAPKTRTAPTLEPAPLRHAAIVHLLPGAVVDRVLVGGAGRHQAPAERPLVVVVRSARAYRASAAR